MGRDKMIPVTKPFQPPLDEYQALLKEVWERNWFTNNGPLVRQFEAELQEKLELDQEPLFVTNGTIAIQLAIKALGLCKKIITTPFSYVATTSSIVWENCTPVFVDIDPLTFNICPKSIEEAIDNDTQAILATHCFGNPCDITAIENLAQKYNLKVIYDAAHCFGTKFKGKSVFAFGDISTTSFHATKLMHSVEGGGIFSNSKEIIEKVKLLRNFGHDGFEKFTGLGINGKNSELHAAMGLANMKYIEEILQERKNQYQVYISLLKNIGLHFQQITSFTDYNHSYFPIVFNTEKEMLYVKQALELEEIFPRRYFYPSLNTLDYVQNNQLSVANKIASSILCLPLYHSLSFEEQQFICHIISNALNNT